VLRLFGVAGIDKKGRPLALEITERFAQLGPGRLGGGIALPFAVAALEYDLTPDQIAVELTTGHVDLGLEAELLREPDKRAGAEATAARWLEGAWQRFDANRTARSELRGLLGDPDVPWVGADLESSTAGRAAAAISPLVESGADLVRIRVPRDRELRRGLGEEPERPEDYGDAPLAPSGSQRGLGLLRMALDEAAATRGEYVRLAARAAGLAAPDLATVAGLERVDLVYSDAVEGIVEFGIEPQRAFTDHIFALELLARAGTLLALGPGPLAAAREIARGQALGSATRAGGALAMQAVSLELSLQTSLAADRILLGALPADLLVAPDGLRHGLAEVELRRLVFPGHGLVFEEPEGHDGLTSWPPALTAWCTGGDPPALVLRATRLSRLRVGASEVRAAAEAAGWLASSRKMGSLTGDALRYARKSLDVALSTLDELATNGWEPLLEEAPTVGRERRRLGAAGLVERRQYFDPFEVRPSSRQSGPGA
jgi:D-lysine 5,6-aminomutase alpha subunit-like protein